MVRKEDFILLSLIDWIHLRQWKINWTLPQNDTRRPSSNTPISSNSKVNGFSSSTEANESSSEKSSSKRTSLSSTDEFVVNGNGINKVSNRKSLDSTSSNGIVTPTIEITTDIESKIKDVLNEEEMKELEDQIFDRLMRYYQSENDISPVDLKPTENIA